MYERTLASDAYFLFGIGSGLFGLAQSKPWSFGIGSVPPVVRVRFGESWLRGFPRRQGIGGWGSDCRPNHSTITLRTDRPPILGQHRLRHNSGGNGPNNRKDRHVRNRRGANADGTLGRNRQV